MSKSSGTNSEPYRVWPWPWKRVLATMAALQLLALFAVFTGMALNAWRSGLDPIGLAVIGVVVLVLAFALSRTKAFRGR